MLKSAKGRVPAFPFCGFTRYDFGIERRIGLFSYSKSNPEIGQSLQFLQTTCVVRTARVNTHVFLLVLLAERHEWNPDCFRLGTQSETGLGNKGTIHSPRKHQHICHPAMVINSWLMAKQPKMHSPFISLNQCICQSRVCFSNHLITVDGQNPAPPRMMIIPIFIGFQLSQAVQDFFHQQYHLICENLCSKKPHQSNSVRLMCGFQTICYWYNH